MPSSISSSESAAAAAAMTGPRRHTRAVVALLLGLASVLIGAEAFTRLVFPRVSKLERRTTAEFAAATSIRPSAAGQLPTVLLLGNSLLLEGLDYQRIRTVMADEARVRRFVVENTTYLDWYFGMKRLLAGGSRPDFIVLCLNPAQLVGSSLRTDYSPYYLMDSGDISVASHALHYDLTEAAGLFFAHYSMFYARRNTLRTFVLNRVDMPYSELVHNLVVRPPVLPKPEELTRIAERRLLDLNKVAASHGVRFSLLLPPGFMPGEKAVAAAAEQSGTKVMSPIHTNELGREYFADGFHLNQAGAQLFTNAIATELRNWVGPGHTTLANRTGRY